MNVRFRDGLEQHGDAWSGPVLVLTHHPEQLASDRTVEAVSDLETALARAEELAAGRAVGIFGADVGRQVLALGRLDEIILQIVPVVLGDGVRLLGEAPTPRVRLERTYVGTSGTLTDIRFRVAGPPTS
jgi:dihydrofolate reductase